MKHNTWKWFLIRRFLLILILVSLSESLLNLFYGRMFYPWLEEKFHINFFMAKWEQEQTLGLLLRGVIYFSVTSLGSQFPDIAVLGLQRAAERFAGQQMTDYIMGQTRHMSGREARIYLAGTAALTILIVITLLLPYLLAALAFSRMVALHIRQIETLEQQQREEYDRRRNLLLSDVAHDLKTPMTTVAGYARALLEEQDAPVREYLEAIYGKSMQMSGLISLLFEYVKLDSEGYQLKKSQENLWELLRECVASLYLDFEEKEMEISADIPEEPLWFPADKLQFQRVISNLLNNAIRHNPRGTKVLVEAAAEEETILIRISDSGTEISEEIAEYIFDPFVSGDESRRSKGGSGLGLCIAHKIIAMHQGSLTLEQNHSQGETKSFVIRLPAAEETLR